ncbi:hypothetical protein KKA15_01200 [Patescibacteria group bacterium]|nr:hypothetical protein [Patescibacteria group bacterium]
MVNKIKLLNQIQPRKEWKDSFRDILISEISQDQRAYQPATSFFGFFSATAQAAKFHVFQPTVAILLVLGLFVGSSLVVNAAFYSLPGDNLYDLKIAMEKTQVSIIRDNEKKAELRMEFAKNRVDELDKMAILRPEDLQKDTISEITKRFKSDVESLNDHINNLDQQKKSVFSLARAIDSQATEFAKTLNKNKDKLPDNVKKEVEKAMDDAVNTAENTSESAFRIALNNYSQGETQEEEEVIELIQSKINNLEQKIKELEDGEILEAAQKALDDAKNSLANGEFDLTAVQIAQGQTLVEQLITEQNQAIDEEEATSNQEDVNLEENDDTNTEESEEVSDFNVENKVEQVSIQSNTSTINATQETLLETTEDIIE